MRNLLLSIIGKGGISSKIVIIVSGNSSGIVAAIFSNSSNSNY